MIQKGNVESEGGGMNSAFKDTINDESIELVTIVPKGQMFDGPEGMDNSQAWDKNISNFPIIDASNESYMTSRIMKDESNLDNHFKIKIRMNKMPKERPSWLVEDRVSRQHGL